MKVAEEEKEPVKEKALKDKQDLEAENNHIRKQLLETEFKLKEAEVVKE